MQQEAASERQDNAEAALPVDLVVDLDGTLCRVDTLHETFAQALFSRPLAAVTAIFSLPLRGRARFKARMSDLASIDAHTLPLNDDLLDWLYEQREGGRRLHLATAADSAIAARVADRLQIFDSVHASENGHNLKGAAKAERLTQQFPDGFAYAGDSEADLAVWEKAASAVVVSTEGLERRLIAAGGVVEQRFTPMRGGWRSWAKALRPHQWSKNMLALAAVLLGWPQLTTQGLFAAVAATGLLCILASLTYLLNDISDLAADRRHWSKRRRPFAAGALPVRYGLIAAIVGIPLTIALGVMISPMTGATLAAYGVLTLAYSFGLKRIPLFDAFIIGVLFTLRLVLGVVSAQLEWSVWLLTFSMFFFFSLALAKRHTEILRAAAAGEQALRGRGYLVGDRDVTLGLGLCTAMASVLLLVLYLMDEVFPAALYPAPGFLWLAPCAVFLWVGRIWLLAHRGQMTDDPVVFALKDKISLVLGATAVLSFLAAML
jgi:4-hydroxybenzoate polyprenyltransferase